MEHITEILAAVGGAALWAIAHRGIAKKTNVPYPLHALEGMNLELRQENSFLRQENTELRGKIQQTEQRVFILEQRVNLIESVPNDIPLPMWMKDPSGRMEYLNTPYEDVFLKQMGLTIQDYLGKTDYEIWPKEIADAMRLHDREVFERKIVFNGRENIPDALGNIKPWRVIKYVRWAGPIPVGIAGVAFPDNGEFENFLKK